MTASGDDDGIRARALILAHCSRLDPRTPNARERLEATLGPTLARRLVYALSRRPAA
ncbi:MAG TPA: hypothetical protein VE261_08240 [Gaiellaceae bacterium]|nr:hypothetical protein [Gaiellaceae bacterium]